MSLAEIERVLGETIGLDPSSVGRESIRRVVLRRMQEVGLDDPHDYSQLVQRSQRELEELVEGVSIPETWFFRDAGVYDYLTTWVRGEWLPVNRDRRLKILCIPCSTGEEPYSVAMALSRAGFSAFEVIGFDIRHSALRKARSGCYGKGSFRGSDLAFRDRYFKESNGEYILSSSIGEKVEFRHGNILNRAKIGGRSEFDLVFCRNLMIYLDGPARQLVSESVTTWLRPGGLLFSGHAETEFVWGGGFRSLRQPGAFAYTRAVKQEKVPIKPRIATTDPDRRRVERKEIAEGPARGTSGPRSDPEAAVRLRKEARRLADAGEMDRAEVLCTRALAEHGGDAEIYFLLGLVHQTRANARRAEELFRRALELSPDHYESLVTLALELDARGERDAAQELRQRAESSWQAAQESVVE